MARGHSETPLSRPFWLKLALVQGIVAPVLFGLIAIVGGAMRPGYSHFSQAISELTEAGAVDKAYLDPPLFLVQLLTILFGIGLLRAVPARNRHLQFSAVVMILLGALGLFYARYPMDPMGSAMTADGRMHLIIVSVSALGAIAAVLLAVFGWRRVPNQQRLARISVFVLVVMLASGIISGVTGFAGWPGIGLWQRLNIAAFSLWQIATAVTLLNNRSGKALWTIPS